jgi:transposase-like protein
MPRCPLCGSAHIVVTFHPRRRGRCFGCDLEWGLDDHDSLLAAKAGPADAPGPAADIRP